VTRWLVKDLGRLSLYLAAQIIEAMLGRVCAHDLLVAAEMNKTCSRGRVLAFLERLEQVGWAQVSEGQDQWTRRPLIFAAPFYTYGRRRFGGALRVVAPLLPEASRALVCLDDPRALAAGLAVSGQVTVLRRDLVYDTGGGCRPGPDLHPPFAQTAAASADDNWNRFSRGERDCVLTGA